MPLTPGRVRARWTHCEWSASEAGNEPAGVSGEQSVLFEQEDWNSDH